MFSRDHHNLIETVLESLNSELFRDTSCYFGGGTAIALRFGEFRESIDVDFMVSSAAGYRTLRELIKSSGFKSIMVRQVPLVRDPVTDQYGIRAILDVGGTPIKFEIVSEGVSASKFRGGTTRYVGWRRCPYSTWQQVNFLRTPTDGQTPPSSVET
ncbi:hypothetical protein GCM10020255_024940 [Rhodococcus baikonurensis]